MHKKSPEFYQDFSFYLKVTILIYMIVPFSLQNRRRKNKNGSRNKCC